jgi:hypothetical protein
MVTKSGKKPAPKKAPAKKAATPASPKKKAKKAPIAPKVASGETKQAGKHAGGRPSDYKPEYAEQARKFCLLGATDKDLAEFFDVVESTINKWKLDHPEFSESVKAGKIQADAKVAESLFKRATGYVGTKTVTATDKGIITDIREVNDFVGPDTTAGIFWLKNRQKEKWRDKQDHEHSGPGGGPQQHEHKVTVSAEEAYRQMLDG